MPTVRYGTLCNSYELCAMTSRNKTREDINGIASRRVCSKTIRYIPHDNSTVHATGRPHPILLTRQSPRHARTLVRVMYRRKRASQLHTLSASRTSMTLQNASRTSRMWIRYDSILVAGGKGEGGRASGVDEFHVKVQGSNASSPRAASDR